MDRNTETRLWLMDRECELRPLTAAARLETIKASDGLMDKYGGGEEAKVLLRGAFMTAMGLYDGEKPVFSSGEEALEYLTPEEIIGIYEMYGEIKLPDMTEHGDEGDKMPPQGKKTEIYNQPQGIEKAQTRAEQGRETLRKRTADGENRNESADSYSSGSYIEIRKSTAIPERMESISDFFERDSRRYDGAFELY